MSEVLQRAIKLNAVVAMCNKNGGIGNKGSIPWRLPRDLKFFAQITKHTEDKSKQNAVIVGRKTWFSIPKAVRPLPGRINIIISNTITDKSSLDANENANYENIHLCKSFTDALTLVKKHLADRVENVYVIGGAEMYRTAFEHENFDRLYLTRVFMDSAECDVFMPNNFLNSFEKISSIEKDDYERKHVNGYELNKIQNENNIDFIFEIYSRK